MLFLATNVTFVPYRTSAMPIGAAVQYVTYHGIFSPPLIRVRPNLRTDNEAHKVHE